MNEEYVRKDYHDVTMREIKALMDANLAKQDANMAKQEALNAKQETMYTEIKGDIKNINTRIDGVVDTFTVAINDMKERLDDIKVGQSLNVAQLGIVVAIVVCVVQVAVSLLMR
ncbi:MAG: hypothetical protein IJR27_06740 [Synergistaceae bacterium]|nr:hypothetical protein [Synergistaceae bacterium]